MKNNDFSSQLNKLEKRHKWERWSNLILGIFCAFSIFGIARLDIYKSLGLDSASLWAGIVGGLLIGTTIRN